MSQVNSAKNEKEKVYLENGLNMTSVEYSNMKLQLFEMSKPIDEYYSTKEYGVIRKKPLLKSTKWWRDIRKRIRNKTPSRWIEACVALLDFPVDEQVSAEKAFKKIKKNVKKNWLRPGYINSVVIAPPIGKTNAIVLLAFRKRHKEKRHAFMENIASKVFSEGHARYCIVIAVNIDRDEYPYSTFGMFDRTN